MRTTLWRYHLGGGCALALAYVYLPFPPLRIAALVAPCLTTIAATLEGRSSARSWWSTTSRSSTCTPAGSPGPRRWSAGPARTAGWSPRPSSIPLAEETGLVVELDRFVLRQVAGWVADAGPLLPHVNLSAHHLLRSDLAGNVAAALRDSGQPPECLALELTESVLMHDLEVAIVRLHELKRLGVGLAIDDFGTGYSSLAYLRQMPIDAVKIDKSFVDGVAGAAEESAVARAIIALATTLHLDTVAEGVERPEQATALAELGCHLAQGYHFSRPIPAADMARLTGQRPVATTLSHPA